MKRAWLVLGYVAVWLVLAGILAPVLYLGFHSVFHHPFSRYVNRSLMISALLLLWPLLRLLQIKTGREWGVAWPESGIHCLKMPFLAGLSAILGLVGFAVGGGWMMWMSFAGWKVAGSALLAAALVPVLEGLLFRGLFQFVLVRAWGRIVGIVGVSLLFAVVHFLKVPREFQPDEVGWLDGFRAIGLAFGPLLAVDQDWQRFITVWAVGLVLGFVAWRDGHIWRSVAIHAGWIFGLQLARGFTQPGKPHLHWETRLDGSMLTVIMLVVFAGYWFAVLDRHNDEKD
jgi:membrane protease YdiL (CAAX protease family)